MPRKKTDTLLQLFVKEVSIFRKVDSLCTFGEEEGLAACEIWRFGL